MKIILFVAALLLPVFSLAGQTSLREGPTVNGIKLGATQQQVLKRFGKPLSEVRKEAEPCVGGTELTLRYSGIKIVLWDDPADEKKFLVGMVEVTSTGWAVSGARVGHTTASIQKRFGSPNAQETDPDSKLPFWFYEMNDESPGNTHFTFRNGKVVKITALYFMC